ncbi:serine/threonine-protein kinase [Limnoglobus roseus]|uniref:Serine/threonine protein kinase n=1 Tax=Limnoglobus roseus TaxID=2598579 RepID=A0A5C1AQL5_9BACT|nr:serine/threonine-protein kinase [Limnoglobus roseus]QEL20032.1 serine/threonine protein kinase [Limnoglobus roseus]
MSPSSSDPLKPADQPETASKLTETYLPSQDASAPSLPSSPSSSLSLPPELLTLTQYEILKEIGSGGMGQVYLAQDKFLRRPVVLKIVKTERLHRSSAIQRFITEMQSAARLNHPNVVIAYTSHQVNEFLVFVMEYVPGDDLSKIVKGHGRLAVPNAVYYVHQVARGLQHAHENGLVHRDIKPSNLILNKNGKKHTVKILDFGLAKARIEDEEPNAGLTGTGKMLGTPDYVAPEQIRDAATADIRADLYSLGCTLYFLLAGEPPFRGRNEFELQEAHVFKTARPLNLLRPEVPVELANIVNKLMAKEPGKRYQTPGEVVAVLTPFLKGGLGGAANANPPAQNNNIEEDVERTGEVNRIKRDDAKPTVSGGSTVSFPTAAPVIPPAVPPVIPLAPPAAVPVAPPPKLQVAKAIPIGPPPSAEHPAIVPFAGIDDPPEADAPRRSRDFTRMAAGIKPHIWWLVWGYLQLVFVLLVAGVTASVLSIKEADPKALSSAKTDAGKLSSEKMPTEKTDADTAPKSSKPKGQTDVLAASTVSTAPPGSIGLFVVRLPAIVGLFGMLFLYSQPKAAGKPLSSRWVDRKWWIGTFLLAWLLGLAAAPLFIDTSVLVVVAFLVVLGLGAGIAVFLSRSAGNPRPRYYDEDDRRPDDRPYRS